MAVNTVVDGNFLVIDDGVKKKYFNAVWCGLSFSDEAVTITDQGKLGVRGDSVSILFTDFQYDGTPAGTETAIFDALKTNIG